MEEETKIMLALLVALVAEANTPSLVVLARLGRAMPEALGAEVTMEPVGAAEPPKRVIQMERVKAATE